MDYAINEISFDHPKSSSIMAIYFEYHDYKLIASFGLLNFIGHNVMANMS